MKSLPKKIASVLALVSILIPLISTAASLKYAAWMPFWKKQPGAQEIATQLDKFSEISPFSYEVRSDGSLKDSVDMGGGFLPAWTQALRDAGVKIIPTIAILDGDQIYALISNSKKRAKHIANIVKLVKDNKYDGVDIDYEDKASKTRPYFNAFLKELWNRLPVGTTLSCTIESRTPVSALFTFIAKDIT